LLEHIHRAITIQARISDGGLAGGGQPHEDEGEGEDSDDDDDNTSDDSEDSEDSEDYQQARYARPQAQEHEQDEDEDEDDADERVDRLVAQNESEPLNREEIGKLLILTSRAYTSKILSANQRSFLKTQIVAQHGMLRVVLQFPTLESIMSALKTISSSVDEE